MIRLGLTLMFFGFISAILHFTDVQFRILMWSEPMQPALGLIVGGAGVLVLVAKLVLTKDEAAPQQFAPQQPGFAPQQGFQPQTGPNSGPVPAMAPPVQQQQPVMQQPMMRQPMPGQPMPQAAMPQGQYLAQPPMPQGQLPPQGYPQPGYGAPQQGYGQPQQFGPQG